MAVRIDHKRDAVSSNYLIDKHKIANLVFGWSKDGSEDLAGGVIDSSKQSNARFIRAEPAKRASINLDQFAHSSPAGS